MSQINDSSEPSVEVRDTASPVARPLSSQLGFASLGLEHHELKHSPEFHYESVKVTHTNSGDVDTTTVYEGEHVLAPVVHEQIKHEEVEEISRHRQHDQHIHHVEHHVQPIIEKDIRDEVHHTAVIAETEVVEEFANTHKDRAAFQAIGEQFKDLVVDDHITQRQTVDLGELVTVTEKHHITRVIQPVIERETHDRHRIHTTVPIHHVTHEAPIIHTSVQHQPLSMADFLKKGGTLSSKDTHTTISHRVLVERCCDREVKGEGFNLLRSKGFVV